MALPKTTQEGLTDRIILEAKQFAFYNYCSAAFNQEANFEDMDTWPYAASVAYYAISNYMSGNKSCWPYGNNTIPMDLKDAAFETALAEWKGAGKEVEYQGTILSEPAPGIALGCISPEASELLDTIMEQWDKHYKKVKTEKYEPTFYAFAYWLTRWSGLIQPAIRVIGQPCPHCGKELSRDRNLCCRECGKEVENGGC